MGFCYEFTTAEEASNNYPKKDCDSCPYQIMDDGVITCKKIQEYIMSNYNKERTDSNENN